VLTPDDENDDEEMDRLEIVTGRAPTDDKVTAWLTVCPCTTLPRLTDEEPTARVGVAAPN